MPKFNKKTASQNGKASAAARRKKYGKGFNVAMGAIAPKKDPKTGRFVKKPAKQAK